MGLLDSLAYDPQMALGMGLLGASGNSRTPVSLGQALGAGWGNMQEAQAMKQKAALQELQMRHMKEQMANEAMMRPLQLEQLKAAVDQAKMQAKVPEQFAALMDALKGKAPSAYQDQVTPEMVGAKGMPQAEADSPENYFKAVAAIPDTMKEDKLAAYEAGFRKWPQFRPQSGGSATNRDPATAIGAYGAMLGAAGLKGADPILKFAGMLNPTELKGGSTYENRLTGQREFIPMMKEGQMPDGRGGMAPVPGFLDFTQRLKQAEVDPIAAARLKYETGMDVNPSQGQTPQTPNPAGLSPKAAGDIKQSAFTGANEDWLKNSYRPVLESAKSADSMLTTVQSLRNIDINTGWGTEAKANAANVLTGLGVAPKNAEMFATKAQQFQSQAMTRLWEVLNTAKGPQTEGDADRAKQTFASLKNTNKANEFVIDLAEATARRDKLKAAFYSEAMPIARDSGDLTAVDRKWTQIQKSIWSDPIMAKWKK